MGIPSRRNMAWCPRWTPKLSLTFAVWVCITIIAGWWFSAGLLGDRVRQSKRNARANLMAWQVNTAVSGELSERDAPHDKVPVNTRSMPRKTMPAKVDTPSALPRRAPAGPSVPAAQAELAIAVQRELRTHQIEGWLIHTGSLPCETHPLAPGLGTQLLVPDAVARLKQGSGKDAYDMTVCRTCTGDTTRICCAVHSFAFMQEKAPPKSCRAVALTLGSVSHFGDTAGSPSPPCFPSADPVWCEVCCVPHAPACAKPSGDEHTGRVRGGVHVDVDVGVDTDVVFRCSRCTPSKVIDDMIPYGSFLSVASITPSGKVRLRDI